MAYSDSLLVRILNSLGNKFTNICENKVLANISELTVCKLFNVFLTIKSVITKLFVLFDT